MGKKFKHCKKNLSFRGHLGAGTLYAIVALLIVALGSAAMIGNIIPLTTSSPPNGQSINLNPSSPPVENYTPQQGSNSSGLAR